MRLTIKNATATKITPTTSGRRTYSSGMVKDKIIGSSASPAAAGAGTPVKKVEAQAGGSGSSMAVLKRAKRNTHATAYNSTKIQPNRPMLSSDQKYNINAGATPKQIMSDSESSSAPNFDVPFNRRAMRPSRASRMAAARIASAACSQRAS